MRTNFRILKIFILVSLVFSTILSGQFGQFQSTQTAEAATLTFVPATTGTWNTRANWSGGLVPTTDDDVTIKSGQTVTIPAASVATFKSLTIATGGSVILSGNLNSSSGTITVSGTLTKQNATQQTIAGDLTINRGGTLTHSAHTGGSLAYSVNFKARNITINSGAIVNVDSKGYKGGGGTGGTQTAGYGPGGGGGATTSIAGTSASGGGYGGAGGYCYDVLCNAPGGTYGDTKNITQPGSGGGGNTTTATNRIAKGGGGGGLVVLEATQNVTIASNILARGGSGVRNTYAGSGGGSGGGISIKAKNNLNLTGGVYVNGGDGAATTVSSTSGGGGGGGGRIYLGYGSFSGTQPTVLSVAGGTGKPNAGVRGSLVTEAAYYTPPAGKIGWTAGNIGNWNDTTGWATSTAATGLVPSVNDDVIIGATTTLTVPAGTTANFKSLEIGGSSTLILEGNIASGGAITVRSGGTLIQKNSTTQTITGSLTVDIGGTLTHESEPIGSTQAYTLDFVAPDILINGTVNVNAKGFQGGKGTVANGYGPAGGAGISITSYGPAGGGGGIYGPETMETLYAGSGGGALLMADRYAEGGNGGGVVKLNATNSMTINGSVLANGQNGNFKSVFGSGGGSGGAIKLLSKTIKIASGVRLSANGGDGGGTTCDAGGGGMQGRIYMGYETLSDLGSVVSISAGLSPLKIGSICYGRSPASAGTLISEQIYFTLPSSLPADAVAWVGGNDGDWNVATNWLAKADSTNRVPTLNDKVFITRPATVYINSEVLFGSLEVWSGATLLIENTGKINGGSMVVKSGATVTQLNLINQSLAGNFTLESGANLTHGENDGTSQQYAVSFSAYNILIGGTINVDKKGFKGGETGHPNGYGPGASTVVGVRSGGAGHGGAGGKSSVAGAVGGAPYDTASNPSIIGSGGGRSTSTVPAGTPAGVARGDGGGLVILNADDTISVDGQILASGGDIGAVTVGYPGGGSGGSIKLTASRISISGIVRANGGSGAKSGTTWVGGGGSGGLIYLGYWDFKPLSLTGGIVEALGGYGYANGSTTPFVSEKIYENAIDYTDTEGWLHIIGKTPTENILMGPDGNEVANPGSIDFDFEAGTANTGSGFCTGPDAYCNEGLKYAKYAAHLIETAWTQDPVNPLIRIPTEYEWRGWGWSSNIGWVSFYCGDESDTFDLDGNLATLNTYPTNMGIQCADNFNKSYRIAINATTGDFITDTSTPTLRSDHAYRSPYAWNEATGFIQMRGTGTTPTGTSFPYNLRMIVDLADTTYTSSLFTGIDIVGVFGSLEKISSWSWSESLGWLEFSDVKALLNGEQTICPPPDICDYTDPDPGLCVIVDPSDPTDPTDDPTTPPGLGGTTGENINPATGLDRDVRIADGADSYQVYLKLRDKSGNLIKRSQLTSTTGQPAYKFDAVFNWEDTVKCNQIYGGLITNPRYDLLKDPFYQSGGGCVMYKPIAIKNYTGDDPNLDEPDVPNPGTTTGSETVDTIVTTTTSDPCESGSASTTQTTYATEVITVEGLPNDQDGKTEGEWATKYCHLEGEEYPIITTPATVEEEACRTKGGTILNLTDPYEMYFKVRSLAPTYDQNYSLTEDAPDDGTTDTTISKVLNGTLGDIPNPYDIETLPENGVGMSRLKLNSVDWQIKEMATSRVTKSSISPDSSGSSVLAFHPALEVSTLRTDSTDPNNIEAYRGIPVTFNVGVKSNMTTGSMIRPTTSNVNLYMYYAPNYKDGMSSYIRAEDEPFDFELMTQEQIEEQSRVENLTAEQLGTDEPPEQILQFDPWHFGSNSAEIGKALSRPFSDFSSDWYFNGTLNVINPQAAASTSEGVGLFSVISYWDNANKRQVSYYNNHLPRVPAKLFNPVAKILGNIYAQLAFTPQENEGDRQMQAVGDPNSNRTRDAVYKNVQQAIRELDVGAYANEKNATKTMITTFTSPDCVNQGACKVIDITSETYKERIIYIKDRDVEIGDATMKNAFTWKPSTDGLPWNVVVVADGGNVYINQGMQNGDYDSTLGIVAFRNPKYPALGASGNAYLNSSVKNLQSVAIILDGTLFSSVRSKIESDGLLSNGEPIWDTNENDRRSALTNQLMLEGILQSRNTIGGGELSGELPNQYYTTGTGVKLKNTVANRIRAQQYDLNFLRFFKLDLDYDKINGYPIDKQCGRALTPDEIKQFKAYYNAPTGTVNPPSISNGSKACNGIDMTRPVSGEGDLVAVGTTTLADGGEIVGNYPVFIKYVPPSNKSFIFSSNNILTF